MVRPSPAQSAPQPGRNASFVPNAPQAGTKVAATVAHRRATNTERPATVPFTILIDKQEGAPYSFRGLRGGSDVQYRPLVIPTRRMHLKTGDYSLSGTHDGRAIDLRDRLTIERKSLPDLFGSLAGTEGERRKRFKAEHQRMQEMILWGGIAHVVIEAAREDVTNNQPEYGAHPNAVLGTSVSWPHRYNVPWHWAGSRAEAERLTFDLLEHAWRVLVECAE